MLGEDKGNYSHLSLCAIFIFIFFIGFGVDHCIHDEMEGLDDLNGLERKAQIR